jgi:hypothetical protein
MSLTSTFTALTSICLDGSMPKRLTAAEVLKRYTDEELPEFVGIELNDVNEVGLFGDTPLHVAAIRGDLDEGVPTFARVASLVIRPCISLSARTTARRWNCCFRVALPATPRTRMA